MLAEVNSTQCKWNSGLQGHYRAKDTYTNSVYVYSTHICVVSSNPPHLFFFRKGKFVPKPNSLSRATLQNIIYYYHFKAACPVAFMCLNSWFLVGNSYLQTGGDPFPLLLLSVSLLLILHLAGSYSFLSSSSSSYLPPLLCLFLVFLPPLPYPI